MILITAMDGHTQGVVDVKTFRVSNSVPNTPVTKTKTDKSFLKKTPIPKTKSLNWKDGVPTPVQDSSITPNQQAIHLLARFASGQIQMSGNKIKHLSTVDEENSISDSLNELNWDSPLPSEKKKIDG